jgi:hypothetical protein
MRVKPVKELVIIGLTVLAVVLLSYRGSDYFNRSIMGMLLGDTSGAYTVSYDSKTDVEGYIENGQKMMRCTVRWKVTDQNGNPVSGVELLEDVDYDSQGWTGLGTSDANGIVEDVFVLSWSSGYTETFTQWVKIKGYPDSDKIEARWKWTCNDTWSEENPGTLTKLE